MDLHGHMNKRGVFAFGNALDSERRRRLCVRQAVLAQHPALRRARVQLHRENMRTQDKNGQTKEGSGRVALRQAGTAAPVHGGGEVTCRRGCSPGFRRRAGTTAARVAPSRTPVRSVKYTPEVLNDVGRALMIAALDLQGEGAYSGRGFRGPSRKSPRCARVGEERGEGTRARTRGTSQGSKMLARSRGR